MAKLMDVTLKGKGGQQGKLVQFEHDKVGILRTYLGLNEIEWGYKLNTASYPTYGGEVVQILSASVEVMNIMGDLSSYEDMMQVYTFFFNYFQVASQGRTGNEAQGEGRYNQHHMAFKYPERNWTFYIQPMSAPGFRIGRDIVIPSWRISAHVEHFHARDLTNEIKDEAALSQAVDPTGKYHPDKKDYSFFSLKGKTGFTEASPFSDPFSSVTQSGAVDAKGTVAKASEYYRQLLPAYMQGDFQSLLYGFGSKPASGHSNSAQDQQGASITKLQKETDGN